MPCTPLGNMKVAVLAWGANWEKRKKEVTNRHWVPAQLDDIQCRYPSISVLHLDARPYCAYDEENAWKGPKGNGKFRQHPRGMSCENVDVLQLTLQHAKQEEFKKDVETCLCDHRTALMVVTVACSKGKHRSQALCASLVTLEVLVGLGLCMVKVGALYREKHNYTGTLPSWHWGGSCHLPPDSPGTGEQI